VRPNGIKWTVNTFGPFKSARPDRIFPALLQRWLELIVGPLIRVLRACVALGYTQRVETDEGGVHSEDG